MGLRPHSLQARLLYTGPGRRSQDYFFIYKLRGAAGRRSQDYIKEQGRRIRACIMWEYPIQ